MLLYAFACAAPCDTQAAESDTGTIDSRFEIPDPGENEVQLLGVPLTVEPGQDVMYCQFGTWEGGDAAMQHYAWYQDPTFGHHFMLMTTDFGTDEFADGEVVDCTDPDVVPMTHSGTWGQANSVLEPGVGAMELPEGVAVRISAGQRYFLEEHWINNGTRAAVVQDAVNIRLVEPSSVTAWASAWTHDNSTFSLEPGQTTSATMDCRWEADYTIVSLLGHMHEFGTAFQVDWTHGETTETIYEVSQWKPEYRTNPVINGYAPGELGVHAGDRFLSTCTWFNDSDSTLVFPTEMCDTVGMLYPSETTVACEPGRLP